MPPTKRLPLYHDSVAFLDIQVRLKGLEAAFASSVAVANRTERALTGGWNEEGTKWITGVREDVRDMKTEVAQLKQNMAGNSRKFTAIAAGVWAVALVVMTEILNSFFGFWGANQHILHGGP